jgi:putative transposase
MLERAANNNPNNKDWQFWQQHNNPLEITGQAMFDEKLLYVHQSTVQAGFVIKEKDSKYSSARDFCGMKRWVALGCS